MLGDHIHRGVLHWSPDEQNGNPNPNGKELAHRFVGPEVTAKEVDCVLIFDEAGVRPSVPSHTHVLIRIAAGGPTLIIPSAQFCTLEKLDSFVNLTYDKKVERSHRLGGSRASRSRSHARP